MAFGIISSSAVPINSKTTNIPSNELHHLVGTKPRVLNFDSALLPNTLISSIISLKFILSRFYQSYIATRVFTQTILGEV